MKVEALCNAGRLIRIIVARPDLLQGMSETDDHTPKPCARGALPSRA